MESRSRTSERGAQRDLEPALARVAVGAVSEAAELEDGDTRRRGVEYVDHPDIYVDEARQSGPPELQPLGEMQVDIDLSRDPV